MARKTILFLISFSMVSLILGGMAVAVPGEINYQGVLKDSTGNPLTGSYQMTFAIYNTASGGSSLWSETQTVSVEGGLYNVRLGASSAISASIFDGNTKYLGVKVGTDAEMTPRVALITVPYAFRASTASTADSASTVADNAISESKIQDGAVTPAKLNVAAIDTNGKLPALTSTYVANLDGSQLTNISDSSGSVGYATLAGTASTAAFADYATLAGSASTAATATNADTVDGFHASTEAAVNSILALNASKAFWLYSDLWGDAVIKGINSGVGGSIGVQGEATSTDAGRYGGYFKAYDTSQGVGVYGEAPFYGGHFEAKNAQGAAVFGHATSLEGSNVGVLGKTNSTDGYAGKFVGGKGIYIDTKDSGMSGAICIVETNANPPDPAAGNECNIYLKANYLVIQFKEGTTVRYKYLDLTGTGVTWVHTTTAP